jgi:hypothetical protein
MWYGGTDGFIDIVKGIDNEYREDNPKNMEINSCFKSVEQIQFPPDFTESR